MTVTGTKRLFEQARKVLEDAGFDPTEYSGRGMYGAYCLAVSVDRQGELTRALLDSSADKELLKKLANPRTDSLGRGIVLYWPSIPWAAGGE